MIPVTKIQKERPNVLIEWQDSQHNKQRTVVPIESLIETDEGTFHPSPQMGVPYGFDWELVAITPVTSSALATALRNAGLFTLKDMGNNPTTARGVILGLAGLTVNKLVQFAVKNSKSGV